MADMRSPKKGDRIITCVRKEVKVPTNGGRAER